MAVTLAQHQAEDQLPFVEELPYTPDPLRTLQQFHDSPRLLLLESARTETELGRYSFLMADPFREWNLPQATYGSNPFSEIAPKLAQFKTTNISDLPPFQGGAAGLLAYGLGHAWEKLPQPKHDEFQTPDLAVGFYDWVIAWDHQQNKTWILSHGFPADNIEERKKLASKKLAWIKQKLNQNAAPLADCGIQPDGNPVSPTAAHHQLNSFSTDQEANSAKNDEAEYWSNFTHEEYLAAVGKVRQYITEGDIFQANLSQRLLSPQQQSSLIIYASLREKNPAPFAAYYQQDDWFIASSSPERFVQVVDQTVITRPIKGTRQRRQAEADLYTRDELRQSEKDRSENVMIVDLLRNDLSRVCLPHTIRVPDLCRVEMYETVQHLVSEVRGELHPEKTIWDLIAATFPGGSITGAPKIRAMEIITELETTSRGPYCGSLFYAGFDGSFDSSILIRTLTGRNGWLQLPVGGGIVVQSEPHAEFEETLHKGEGMRRAINAATKQVN